MQRIIQELYNKTLPDTHFSAPQSSHNTLIGIPALE